MGPLIAVVFALSGATFISNVRRGGAGKARVLWGAPGAVSGLG